MKAWVNNIPAVNALPIPASVGVGLRVPHLQELADAACIGSVPEGLAWLEILPETFLCDGPRRDMLQSIARSIPVSCHSVGLSLGSAEGIDPNHLAALRALYTDLKPALISDHLSFSVAGGAYTNDLLPLPMTHEALDVFVRNVDAAQQGFGRQILVENPSVYVPLDGQNMTEAEFLTHLVDRTGCGLLLDVNNIYVSARNTGGNAITTLAEYPVEAIGEIHLATYSTEQIDGEDVLIDTHIGPPCAAVMDLYSRLIARTGAVPTLLEWDTDVPALTTLLSDAGMIQQQMTRQCEAAA